MNPSTQGKENTKEDYPPHIPVVKTKEPSVRNTLNHYFNFQFGLSTYVFELVCVTIQGFIALVAQDTLYHIHVFNTILFNLFEYRMHCHEHLFQIG